jgi:ribosomal protein L9
VYATHDNRIKHALEGGVVEAAAEAAATSRAAMVAKLQALAETGLSITAPASATGTLFAAVSRAEVVDILSSVGVEIGDSVSVVFGTPVKTLGTHEVTVGGVVIGLQIKGANS